MFWRILVFALNIFVVFSVVWQSVGVFLSGVGSTVKLRLIALKC